MSFESSWGVAKLVKAPDFDSGIRRFESFLPSPLWVGAVVQRCVIDAPFSEFSGMKWGGKVALDRLTVFTGNANPKLAEEVVGHLRLPLGRAKVGRFSDGEVMVEILENVRGKDVFVLQSMCAPTNDNLMELLVMVDALKRASAGRVTAAIPYMGYARQDRRPSSARVPITAKVVANMMTSAGVDRVLTMDLHSEQIQGFFDIPVDNIYSGRSCWATYGSTVTRTWWWCRPTWAAWCGRGRSRSASKPISRSSTSGGRGRTSRR